MVAIDACDKAIDRMGHWIGDVGFSLMDRCSYFQILVGTGTTVPGLVINHHFNDFTHEFLFARLIQIRPRQNQIRVFISMLAYTIPILNRGDFTLFAQCWLVLFLSGYFFIAYPLQGWSHAVFHLVICFVPPLLMQAALTLPSSQPYVQTAIHCSRIVNGVENI